jgi:hypothetical protein
MIIEVKTIIPHQRANTPDPSIETPPFRAGRGHVSALAFLVSRPRILTDSAKLLIAVHSYLGGLGLRRLEDYMIELSMWVDAEIEGWSKPQIVVKLLENGLRKISEKGLDEFKLLENMLKTASELVPRETLAEILISVE